MIIKVTVVKKSMNPSKPMPTQKVEEQTDVTCVSETQDETGPDVERIPATPQKSYMKSIIIAFGWDSKGARS